MLVHIFLSGVVRVQSIQWLCTGIQPQLQMVVGLESQERKVLQNRNSDCDMRTRPHIQLNNRARSFLRFRSSIFGG